MNIYFSVIVLTYNKFDNFEDCLSSIFNQTFTDFEIIVSDDGSTNYSDEMINSIISKFHYTGIINVLRHNQNVGTVKNYNDAIDTAQGKYIVPLAQDDVFFNHDVLRKMYEFTRNKNSLIYTSLREGKSSKRIFPNYIDIKLLESEDNNAIQKRLFLSNFISGSVLCIKKSTWIQLGKFDENYYLLEDYPFILKAISNKIQIDIFNEITISYGEDGVTSSVEKISKALQRDLLRNYYINICPQINILSSRFSKRYIKYNVWEIKLARVYGRKFILNILFIDIWYTLYRIRMKAKKNNLNESEQVIKYLMDREDIENAGS